MKSYKDATLYSSLCYSWLPPGLRKSGGEMESPQIKLQIMPWRELCTSTDSECNLCWCSLSELNFPPITLLFKASLPKEVLRHCWSWGYGKKDKGEERLYSDPDIILKEPLSSSCLFLSKGILDALGKEDFLFEL